MPLKDVPVQPGMYTLSTDRGARGRWKNGQWVRFWKGMVEKIGGYNKNSTNTFTGKARAALDWLTLSLVRYIALGTHLKLQLWLGGTYYDITPLRSTATLGVNPFAMTSGSAEVTVTHVAHGAYVDDYVTFSGATAAGGITISGEYQITTMVDVDTYKITHTAQASSTTTGGGAAVEAKYQIHVGVASTEYVSGYGAGAYGAGTYGTTRTLSSLLSYARIWSLDNWGEDLIACCRDQGVYVWDASVGTGTRAAVISGAPTVCKAAFVSEQNRHLVVLGPDSEPLKVKWSDAEDYTDWTPTASNAAGSKLLSGGNELYCAVKTDGETILFTDSVMYSMKFEGPPYVFSFDPKGSSFGIRGPNAAREAGGKIYWMGKKEFYVYDGSTSTLACDVLPTVFDNINSDQGALVFAGANRGFAEVWWLYPSADATECDRYVIYNYEDKTWAFGTLARTVFIGDSDNITNTYACGTDGYIYDHESGVNADGGALSAYAETGDLEIAEGEEIMFVDKLIPDFAELSGTLSLTIKGRRYPKGEQLTKGPYSITSSTEKVQPRFTARQMSLYLSVSTVDANFRMGTLRINAMPDGER